MEGTHLHAAAALPRGRKHYCPFHKRFDGCKIGHDALEKSKISHAPDVNWNSDRPVRCLGIGYCSCAHHEGIMGEVKLRLHQLFTTSLDGTECSAWRHDLFTSLNRRIVEWTSKYSGRGKCGTYCNSPLNFKLLTRKIKRKMFLNFYELIGSNSFSWSYILLFSWLTHSLP